MNGTDLEMRVMLAHTALGIEVQQRPSTFQPRLLAALVAILSLAGGLLVWTGFTAHASLPADNRVTNPSFETDTSGWSPWQGAGLTSVAPPAGTAVPDGSRVAQFAWDGSGSPSVTLDQWPGYPAIIGTTYTASAWVAAPAGSGSLGRHAFVVLREHDHSGAEITHWSSTPVTLTTQFQKVQIAHVPRDAGHLVDIRVESDDAVAGAPIWADAFAVSATAMPSSAVQNGSFESGATSWATNGGSYSVQPTNEAPDGSKVAVITASSTSFVSIDQWPGSTLSTSGRTYRGQALLRGVGTTINKVATLSLREVSGNTIVNQWSAHMLLQANWQQVFVEGSASGSGNHIDIFASIDAPAPGDIFNADGFAVIQEPAWTKVDAASDEFNNGTIDTGKWNISNFPYNGVCYNGATVMGYTPNAVAVSGGSLALTTAASAISIPYGTGCADGATSAQYSAGYVESKFDVPGQNSKIEVRAKLADRASNVGNAIWLQKFPTGSSTNPNPEIDIQENWGESDQVISTLHTWTWGGSCPDPDPQSGACHVTHAQEFNRASANLSSDFHTYTLERRSGYLYFSVDGIQYWQWKAPADNQPFLTYARHILFTDQAWASTLDPGRLPATFLIDWVHTYTAP